MRGGSALLGAALLLGSAAAVLAQADTPAAPLAQLPAPAAAPAPTTPDDAAILTVDQEALWRGSAWGRRAQVDLEAQGAAIAAENDRIAAALEAEDATLTELRKTLSPEEFRADAFDERVQQVRRDRDAAAVALRARVGEERTAFLNASLPVFSEVMAERGAVVVLERDSVFLSADAIDVTSELIVRVDAQVGAGPAPDMAAPPPADAGPQQAP